MAENKPEQQAAETTPEFVDEQPGPQVPKARSGEPESGEQRPAPRKRAKRAAKAAPDASPVDAPEAAKPSKIPRPAKPAKAARSGKASGSKQPAVASHHPLEAWLGAIWDAFRPEQAPDRLIWMIVQESGPRAAAWQAWVRQTYPQAPTDGIARLATHQAVRSGRMVAVTGLGGLGTAPFSVPAGLLVRVNLVLRIAAAYGHDPLDRQRVDELIELLGLAPADSPSWLTDLLERARGGPAADVEADAASVGERGAGQVAAVQLVSGIVRRIEAFGVASHRVRFTRRSAPTVGPSILLRLADQVDGLEQLAHRAIRFYRPGSRSSTDSSAPST